MSTKRGKAIISPKVRRLAADIHGATIRKFTAAAWKILAHLRLANPPRGELVVFDQAGSDRLLAYAFNGLHPAVLPVRYEEVYAGPAVLWRCLLNLRHIRELKLRQLYKVYLLSCLELTGARVVATWVDNSVYFQELSRLYPAQFIAMQNGYRTIQSVTNPSQHPRGWLSDAARWGSVLRLPHFFCFGAHTEELYRRYGHEIGKAYPLGSFLAGYYKTELDPGRAPIEHDLCLISEWRRGIMMGQDYPKVRRGLDALHANLARYAVDRKVRVTVALCSGDPDEAAAFQALFAGAARLIAHERFSCYRTMDRSDVSLSFFSTAAFEAFGWGSKTLLCNYSGDELLTCPIPGPWSLEGGDYLAFCDKLDALRAMPRELFEAESAQARRQLMGFDPERPPHREIRRLAESFLEGSY